ncbi:MAG: RNA polymerase sigma-70 factor [Chitinophagaceae bacterium]|nr:RNA polymerase sigma-70 factor [Chitinophagaceae bacterium]
MSAENELLYQQFKKVFEQYYNELCNYALTFLKDLSSSEDVVQEVFVRIWEKRQDIVTSENIKFYLYVAVRNNSLTYLNKSKKVKVVELNEYDAAEENRLSPEEADALPDYKTQLGNAMDRLPPKCKEVFVLSRLSRQSYKEIAETMGISVKTVENQMGKALRILREFVREKRALFGLIMIDIINLFR